VRRQHTMAQRVSWPLLILGTAIAVLVLTQSDKLSLKPHGAAKEESGGFIPKGLLPAGMSEKQAREKFEQYKRDPSLAAKLDPEKRKRLEKAFQMRQKSS
jgi:hypothetical protein